MENTSERNYVAPIRLVLGKTDNLHICDYYMNDNAERGKFFIPVYQDTELEDRVLLENWNIRDIRCEGKFRTFLEVNFDATKAIVKITYADAVTWITVDDWYDSEKYKNGRIHEINIKPYFYSDEYRRNLIAGQLRFLEIDMTACTNAASATNHTSSDSTSLQEFVNPGSASTQVAKSISKSDKHMQLVNIVYALGLTPKDAIKMLIEEV